MLKCDGAMVRECESRRHSAQEGSGCVREALTRSPRLAPSPASGRGDKLRSRHDRLSPFSLPRAVCGGGSGRGAPADASSMPVAEPQPLGHHPSPPLQPPLQPRHRVDLHRWRERVRLVVEGAEAVRDARLRPKRRRRDEPVQRERDQRNRGMQSFCSSAFVTPSADVPHSLFRIRHERFNAEARTPCATPVHRQWRLRTCKRHSTRVVRTRTQRSTGDVEGLDPLALSQLVRPSPASRSSHAID